MARILSCSPAKWLTVPLPAEPTVLAPDGSEVRVLASLSAGSMAHFRLAPGQVAPAAVTSDAVSNVVVRAAAGRGWLRA